jgi:hypothetical protein
LNIDWSSVVGLGKASPAIFVVSLAATDFYLESSSLSFSAIKGIDTLKSGSLNFFFAMVTAKVSLLRESFGS